MGHTLDKSQVGRSQIQSFKYCNPLSSVTHLPKSQRENSNDVVKLIPLAKPNNPTQDTRKCKSLNYTRSHTYKLFPDKMIKMLDTSFDLLRSNVLFLGHCVALLGNKPNNRCKSKLSVRYKKFFGHLKTITTKGRYSSHIAGQAQCHQIGPEPSMEIDSFC